MSAPRRTGAPAGVVGAAAVVVALAGTLLWALLLASPWRLAAGLLDARGHLARAEKALGRGAVKDARYETLAAAASARRAERGLAGAAPLLDAARPLPYGDAAAQLPHFVDAASHSSSAARGTLELAQDALRGPDKIIVEEDGEATIRLDRVRELAAVVDRVRADVDAARGSLEAVDADALPRRARPAVEEGIATAAEAGAILADAAAGFDVLPSILGEDGPRTYLLGMQNTAEQRGTGGAILQFAQLTIDRGRPRLEPAKTVYELDRNRRPLDVDLPDDAWYVALIEDARRFGNANWSPDWPLSASLTVAYGQAADAIVDTVELPEIDGVIAVDPLALERLMPGVGPYRIDAGNRISAANVVAFVLYKAYAAYPVPSARRGVLRQVVDGFYDRAFHPSSPSALVQGMGDALARKNMQIWLADPAEQGFVERMDWDGSIERAPGSDYLFVVEQNVGGNKLDYYDEHTTSVDVRFDGDDAIVAAEARVHNGVFLPQPRWSMGDSGPVHRPMLNVYAPGDARLLDASVEGAQVANPLPVWDDAPPRHAEREKAVWSATLEIPPGDDGAFRVRYRVPGIVRTTGGRRTYRLLVQHQTKVRPEMLEVRVTLPDGAARVRAPGWSRDGDALVWSRPLTRDVSLEVSWRE